MELIEKFSQYLSSLNGFHKQHKFLLTVSGGIDSVVLCDLFSKCDIDFVIAHCNFQLRGEESVRDENFVRELAAGYGKSLHVIHFDTKAFAKEHKLSTQVAARDLRYNWFRQLLAEGKATYIVTAHHVDDNIETVVMNFFRGTGLKGLIGMDEHFEKVWRPLLSFRKQEIVDYAANCQLEHVEDSSNASSNYTRNYFRNDLLPAIAKVFPGVEENIIKNTRRLIEVEKVYEQAIAMHKAKLIEPKGREEHIAILKLMKTGVARTILWEMISSKNFSAAQVDEVLKLTDAANGSFIESSSHRIIKNRNWLIIAGKETADQQDHLVIEEHDKKIAFPGGVLVIEKNLPAEVCITSDKLIALVDESELQFPLLLRKWKQGDYFYPLGMQKKKKLSRFFIDQKLSLIEKENAWVLESNKRIVWVIGQRIDDRFKVTPKTKAITRIAVVIK